MSRRAKQALNLLALFSCSSLVHLLLLESYLRLEGGFLRDRSPLSGRTGAIQLGLLGGAWLTAFMHSLLRWACARSPAGFFAVVWRGGLWGLVSAWLTIESYYVLISLSWAVVYTSDSGLGVARSALLFMIDVQTYGMLLLMMSSPFGLLSGILAGLYIYWLSKPLVPTGDPRVSG